MNRLLLVLVALTTLAGCGGAKEGESCDRTGFLCADATAALECRAGKWLKLPCRGTGGCQRSGEVITCDMSGNSAGDACASSAEGKGLCSSTGTATLECREGALVQTNTCRTCTVSGEQVICQP
jgi:hypothetical protein